MSIFIILISFATLSKWIQGSLWIVVTINFANAYLHRERERAEFWRNLLSVEQKFQTIIISNKRKYINNIVLTLYQSSFMSMVKFFVVCTLKFYVSLLNPRVPSSLARILFPGYTRSLGDASLVTWKVLALAHYGKLLINNNQNRGTYNEFWFYSAVLRNPLSFPLCVRFGSSWTHNKNKNLLQPKDWLEWGINC